MPKTEYLGLNLTDDDNTKVKDWRMSMDGVGSGENLSNMQIIDKAFGDINTLLDMINGEV
jgi:hypothetical protein